MINLFGQSVPGGLVTQKVDRAKTGPGVQLWQPKVDRPRAKAKCRVKARARIRARARARAQIMPIHPRLQAFVRADHFSQAKIGPGVHFLPRTKYRLTGSFSRLKHDAVEHPSRILAPCK